MPPKKRAKVVEEEEPSSSSLVDKIWEHYRNYLDSCDDEDNPEGDVDELQEIVKLMDDDPLIKKNIPCTTLGRTRPSLLPIVASMAHLQLANCAISQTVDQDNDDNDDNSTNEAILYHLQESLKFFPKNCATWSMGANYARMEQLVSPPVVVGWYQRAATYASELRTLALELLEGDTAVEEDAVKEWIELLILVGMVDTEYFENEDDEDDDDEEDDNKDEKEEEEKEQEDDGYYSSSAVEATSRFMSAMLLSTLGKHNDSLEQLKHFDLSHRLHPNVWLRKTTTATTSQVVDSTEEGPSLFSGGVLPKELHEAMCEVFAPDAAYWKESDYAHRGYYSYYFDIVDQPTNLIEDVIVRHLLPLAKKCLSHDDENDEIIGAEWWTHHRPIQANLGHNLHFDTDETILAQEGVISHPILSSVLYLTAHGGSATGPTIVLDQTPDSTQVASQCWTCVPETNAFMVFDGKLLHGVLPCPGTPQTNGNGSDASDSNSNDTLEWAKTKNHATTRATTTPPHRLTFMVGFWTRRVPDKMKHCRVYGPCGPLPDGDDTEWVQQIKENYPKTDAVATNNAVKQSSLPSITPAWESVEARKSDFLDIPRALDHRFFVKGAPQCFRDSLFDKDEDDDDDDEEEDGEGNVDEDDEEDGEGNVDEDEED